MNTAGLSVAARTYDGTRTAAISGTGTRTGTIYSGDTVTLTQGTLTGLYDSANAGLRTVTVGGFSLSGASAGNYSLAPVQLAATLAQAPLTVQGLFVQDKVYDRTTTATLVGSTGTSLATSTVTLGGIVGSDDVRLLNVASQTAVFADANAATNISVGLTSAAPLSLTGAAAANYVLTAPVLKGNITPATLTVTGGITAQSRAYDGTTNATRRKAADADGFGDRQRPVPEHRQSRQLHPGRQPGDDGHDPGHPVGHRPVLQDPGL